MRKLFAVYRLFIDKLPTSMEDLMPDNANSVTFLNPYSFFKAKHYVDVYSNVSYIASDGIFPLALNKIFGIPNSPRLSFDMSSVAKVIFEYATLHNLSIYFLGAQESQINEFILKIKTKYPYLRIAGFHHGYVKSYETKIINEIYDINPNIVILGLGTPYQDIFSFKLREKGFKGVVYTCGGFIHQGAKKFEYFNGIIDKFHLRAFYRMYKEPYVIKRVLLYYPIFLFSYLMYLLHRKIAKH